jgi:hypothetical protein
MMIPLVEFCEDKIIKYSGNNKFYLTLDKYNLDNLIWEYENMIDVIINKEKTNNLDLLQYKLEYEEYSDDIKYLYFYHDNNKICKYIIVNNNFKKLFDFKSYNSEYDIIMVNNDLHKLNKVPDHIDLCEYDNINSNKHEENVNLDNDEKINLNNNYDKEIFNDIMKDINKNDINKNDIDNLTDIDYSMNYKFTVEYRRDPYDNFYYTRDEFYDYYGGYVEWNYQNPVKDLIRNELYKFASDNDYLNTDKFVHLLNIYNENVIKTIHPQ